MPGTASTRAIWLTYLALTALLAVNWGSSYLELGLTGTVLTLGIAALKAGVVMTWFMGLRQASQLVRAGSLVGFATLAVLLVLSLADYLNRPLQ